MVSVMFVLALLLPLLSAVVKVTASAEDVEAVIVWFLPSSTW